jgi:hypothetical protein
MGNLKLKDRVTIKLSFFRYVLRIHKPDIMKRGKIHIVLAVCLAISGGCSQKDKGNGIPENTPDTIEKDIIKAGLEKTGIGEGYEIVIADEYNPVENTAALMMQKFLGKGGLNVSIVFESTASGNKHIYLGRDNNLKVIKDLGDKEDINIRNISAEDDGFHVKKIGKDIIIAGANPRGVLYGVCAFGDFIKEGSKGKLDIRRVPRFSLRFTGIPVFLMTDHPSSCREISEKQAEYFARLGVNGCIDGGGGSWELSRFVSSDIFPFQMPPDSVLQHRISTASSLFKKYGVDYYIMLWEPTLAKVGAEINKYPLKALGTVKRPWGGDKNGLDKTLCVSSPEVQEHYRNLMKKFVREYPDVKGVLFYNLDGSSWLCTPGLCSRCKTVCTDSPPDSPHPWETQALFTDLLAQAAREERNDFKFIHWISHFHDEAAEKLVRASQEYSALAYGVQNGDHDIMITDAVEPGGSEFLMLQDVCVEKSVPFFVVYASNTHEVIPNGFQLPFHISSSVKKLNSWGIRNCLGSGPIPHFNQVNVLVEKEFMWNPDQNPDTFIRDLSVRQFGNEAGRLMYQAWEEIKNGMDVWNGLRLHPFCGSQTHVSLGFSYFTNARAILPDIAGSYNHSLEILTNVEPHREPDYQKYREKMFLEKFQLMGTHLAKASALAKQAIEKADSNEYIDICYYESDPIPTKKEYTELNYAPIAIADIYCRLRCNMITAYHLLSQMKTDSAAGNSKAMQDCEMQYNDLIREDISVRKRFNVLLAEFLKMKPCLTRTSLSEEGIVYQINYMNTEIERMQNFLNQKSKSQQSL